MESVVLHRVGNLGLFCPTQGQVLNPQWHPYTPKLGQVPPSPDPKVQFIRWRVQPIHKMQCAFLVSRTSVH